MKKISVIVFTILLSIFTVACSYSVQFVVVNESDETVELEYVISMQSYIAHGHEDELPVKFVPSVINAETWKRSPRDEDWKPLSGDKYQVDMKSGHFKLSIPPKSALKLAQLNDSSIFFEDSYKNFEIKSIHIKGKNGYVVYDGDQVLKHFVEKNYTDRFIAYN